MITGAVSAFSEPRRVINMDILAILFLLAVITVLISHYVVPIMSVLNLFTAFIAIKVIAERFDMDLKNLGVWFFGFTLASLVVVALQVIGCEPVYFKHFQEVAGLSELPWVMGCTFVLILPFLMGIHPALGILAVPMIWMSHSSACVVAGFITASFFLIGKHTKAMLCTTLFAPVAVIAFVARDGIDHNRLDVFKNGLSYFGNLWIGNGLGTWAHMPFRHEVSEGTFLWWRWVHNEYYQHAYEQGIIGLFLLLILCLVLFIFSTSKVIRSALLGLYALCILHPVLHWPKLVYLVVFIIAVALSEQSNKLEEST